MASLIYDKFFLGLPTKQIDWTGDSIMIALIDNTYTPAKGDSLWVAGRDPFISEITGAGYTAQGKRLTSPTVLRGGGSMVSGDTIRLYADSAWWTASTITARHAVIYDGTPALKSLICCFDFVTDKTSNSGTFTLVFNQLGILTLQQG
jgi:hypothetical protein